MKSGSLRHRIIIQDYTETQSELDLVRSWTTVATTMASVMPLSGREYERAKTYAATVSHKVCFRYVAGLAPKMRINHQGRIFQINYIIDVEERHDEHQVYCTELIGEQKQFFEIAVGGGESGSSAA